MPQQIRIDPDAFTVYNGAAGHVSAELHSAAHYLETRADPAGVAASVGLVGAEFATDFAAALLAQQTVLRSAAAMIDAYCDWVRDFGHLTDNVDKATAGALAVAGEKA